MMRLYPIITSVFLLLIVSSCSSTRSGYTRSESQKESYAAKITKAATLRDEVIIQASKYAGTPYRYGGKTPSSGFDCSGFVSFVFAKAGIEAPGPSHYQASLGKHKSRSQLRPGDLVFFGNKDKVSHVGIVYSNAHNQIKVIHSTSSRGVVIDNITSSAYWESRYLYGSDLYSIYTSDIYADSK